MFEETTDEIFSNRQSNLDIFQHRTVKAPDAAFL